MICRESLVKAAYFYFAEILILSVLHGRNNESDADFSVPNFWERVDVKRCQCDNTIAY